MAEEEDLGAAKFLKEEVNYRSMDTSAEKCGKCSHYEGDAQTCEVVEGVITPDAVCDMFRGKRGLGSLEPEGPAY